MRILITGAGGQVGRELVDVFEGPGHHEVIATTRGSLDIESRDSTLGVITTVEPDVVIHAAAWTAVDACESDSDRALRANALGTRHVVNGAEIVGARVVYISTDYVFDGELDRPYDEWDVVRPQSVYGRSKLGGEHELRSTDAVVRASWIFGRHGANMVKTILRAAESHDTLSFVDDQHGKPTCAQDLAARIYDLTVARLHGTFHVTNDGATTWFQFARDVMEAAGNDPERVHPISTAELQPPRPAPRPKNSVLDNAAMRLQGMQPLPDHRDAIGRVVKELTSQ